MDVVTLVNVNRCPVEFDYGLIWNYVLWRYNVMPTKIISWARGLRAIERQSARKTASIFDAARVVTGFAFYAGYIRILILRASRRFLARNRFGFLKE